MKKLALVVAVVLAMAMVVVPLSCGKAAAPAPTPSTPTHPEVKLYKLDTSSGSGYLEANMAIDTLLQKNHPWLRLETQESQGYVYNLKVMIDQADRRANTIPNSCPVSIRMATLKQEPFTEGLKGYDPKILANITWPSWGLITLDPNIKTYQDLKGKRIAYGSMAGTATVMSMAFAEGEDLFNICGPVENVAFSKIPSMLLDGLVDAGLFSVLIAPKTQKFILASTIQELIASGKKPHYIPYSQATIDKVKATGMPGVPVQLPANAIPGTDAVTLIANPCFTAADASFPEEYAYEYVKFLINNIKDLNATGGYNALYTMDELPYSWEASRFHPGALKAYKEAGLIK